MTSQPRPVPGDRVFIGIMALFAVNTIIHDVGNIRQENGYSVMGTYCRHNAVTMRLGEYDRMWRRIVVINPLYV